MKRVSLAVTAAGALTLASCSDQDSASSSPPVAEAMSPPASRGLDGRVVGVAYGEMSGRAMVVRESRDGALTACFWNAAPSHSSPMGCVPLE